MLQQQDVHFTENASISSSISEYSAIGFQHIEVGKCLIFTTVEYQLAMTDRDTTGLTVNGLSAGDSFEWNESGTALYLNHQTLVPEPQVNIRQMEFQKPTSTIKTRASIHRLPVVLKEHLG